MEGRRQDWNHNNTAKTNTNRVHSSRLPTNGGKTKKTLWRSYERIDEIHAIPSESQALNEGQHIFEHLLELLYHLLVVQVSFVMPFFNVTRQSNPRDDNNSNKNKSKKQLSCYQISKNNKKTRCTNNWKSKSWAKYEFIAVEIWRP